MKKYKCDGCGTSGKYINSKFYEITFKELPDNTKIQFDLCNECYKRFRIHNKNWYL